ncbi:MAG TPA: AIR synthase-related protein, partial [Solirubrobacteraceae bacterium]|nr:AIR synthase-related protein [Solirubrobacteraceae bacterium]
LNFGNPEKPHIAWQLSESVRGLGDACRTLEAPIVGGNVSLYNEGATGPIYPTPVIGMVGRLPDARRSAGLGFQHAGDHIALVGPFKPSLDASELAKLLGHALPDGLPTFDIDAVTATHTFVRDAIRAGTLSSAHDIAEGGLAVALAECCLAGGLGAEVELQEGLWEATTLQDALFGEGPGGFIVSGEAESLRELAESAPVPVRVIGRVGEDVLNIIEAGAVAGTMLTLTLEQLAVAHGALAELFT